MTAFEQFLKRSGDDFKNDVSPDEKGLYAAVARAGCRLFSVFFVLIKSVVLAVLFAIAAVLRLLGKAKNALVKAFKEFFSTSGSQYGRYRKAINNGKSEISRIKREEGYFAGIKAEFRLFGRVVFGKRGFAVTVFNYVLPVVCCVFLFNIVSYATSQTYALKLTVNGHFLGYIEDETVFTDAEQIISKRINYTGSNAEVVNFTHDYEVDLVGYDSMLSTYQVADRMLQLLDAKIESGYGMFIGEDYYGTLLNHTRVSEALDNILGQYRTDNPTETVAFDKEITFVPGIYLADSFVEENEIIRMVTSYKIVADYYTVVQNDSPYSISEKVNMTIEELARLNPGFSTSTEVHIGDEIKITQEQPFLNVIVTREEHYNEEFDYDTEYVQDNSRYVGMNVIRQNGENGVRAVTANVSYINNVEISRKVLVRTTTKNPVTEIIGVGTMPRPANSAPGATVEAGKFIWPVGGSGGKKTWGYAAPGYSTHRGLDISAPYGTPVFAAETGTITQINPSGYGGGWGTFVVISHGSGVSTRYAHMAGIANIYVGQTVTAGQLIGYVGSTGNSTGNHLHFEVLVGGIRVDPSYYLPSHI
ncbi:MAG: peptidoglycan DD-metalloendopeptidase family protein [Oscillospiraceae bacterium]|nr:peptidoglycan DD-metalloendopeptidase family protein [Oscillospiraceae bacterium]